MTREIPMIPSHVNAFINNLSNRITNLIKRCALTKTANDIANYQIVQCQYLGHVADVESASLYGLSFSAPINSTGIMVNLLGDEENRAAFFNTPQKRFKNLKPWELQIGNYLTRSSVKFAADKSIIINSLGKVTIISADDLAINVTGNVDITATGNVNVKATGTALIESTGDLTLKAPQIILDGNVIIAQNLTVNGTMIGDGVNISTHVHGGVQTGTSNTTPPV